MEKAWLLLASEDEESAVLEAFSEEEGKPTAKYIEDMYGYGVLYEYDVKNNPGQRSALINAQIVEPKNKKRRR